MLLYQHVKMTGCKRQNFKEERIMKIVFASWNPKKAEEIQRMAPKGIEILCLKDIPEAMGIPQVEESGSTFLENALLKAHYWADKLKMPIIAEDSGICINALNGYPGVFTKRCIEQLCPNSEVNEDNPNLLYPLLLKLIADRGEHNTEAYWISSIAFIYGDIELKEEGRVKGNMCECAGERVFGFDQYFKPKGYTKTLSEMTLSEKDSVSPRFDAFSKIMAHFFKIFL